LTAVAIAADLDEAKLAAAHRALLATRGLQFDFAAVPIPKPPGWLEPLLRALAAAVPVLKYVFWGGVIVGVVWLLWIALRDLVPVRYRRRKAATSPADWRPEAAQARALLEDADALARAGEFAEAIHLLLFRSIEDIAAKRAGAVPSALTSREIVVRTPMPETARAAFARIAEVVERTFFGGRAAGEADFRQARGDYEAFAFAEDWQ